MRHWLKKLLFYSGMVGVFLVGGARGFAYEYVVTSEVTKIRCDNGRELVVDAYEVLQLTEQTNRTTYRVQLPPPLDRSCRRGQVKSLDVFNVGSLEEPRVSKKSSDSKSSSASMKTPKLNTHDSEESVLADGQKAVVREQESAGPSFGLEEQLDLDEETTLLLQRELESFEKQLEEAESARVRRSHPSPREEAPEGSSSRTARRRTESQRTQNPRTLPHEANEAGSGDEDRSAREVADGSVLGSGRAANAFFKTVTKKMAPMCRSQFLGKNGLGPWGEHAKEIMSIGFFEDTIANNKAAFSRICPSYSSMNVEQKKNLIVLTMMAQANWESSCRPAAANHGCPNGTCMGIFQLHLGKEPKYVRTPELKKYCPRYASKSAQQSISCSLAMFVEDLWQGESIVGNRRSYWAVLAPQYGNSKVRAFYSLFSKIPDCHKSSLALQRSGRGTGRRARAQDQGLIHQDSSTAFDPAFPNRGSTGAL